MPSSQSASLASRPRRTIRELDHFTYAEKLRHWEREDAWNPGGATLRFENPVYRRSYMKLDGGDIVRCEPLIGRPCFGIATALLRYEHHTRYVRGRGHKPASRCHDCKAKDACKAVVQARLRASEPIEGTWADWLKADGPQAFGWSNFEQSYAYRCWTRLKSELRRHPFTSANDQHVIDAYLETDRVRRT